MLRISLIAGGGGGYKNSIGIQSLYFNAGMLLINLDKWREIDVMAQALAFYSNYPHIAFQDQCMLNGIFQGKVRYCDVRYNFTVNALYSLNQLNKKKFVHKEAIPTLPAVIYHYTGPVKPWHKNCYAPQADKFLHYFADLPNKPTAWLDKVEKRNTISKMWYLVIQKIRAMRFDLS